MNIIHSNCEVNKTYMPQEASETYKIHRAPPPCDVITAAREKRPSDQLNGLQVCESSPMLGWNFLVWQLPLSHPWSCNSDKPTSSRSQTWGNCVFGLLLVLYLVWIHAYSFCPRQSQTSMIKVVPLRKTEGDGPLRDSEGQDSVFSSILHLLWVQSYFPDC